MSNRPFALVVGATAALLITAGSASAASGANVANAKQPAPVGAAAVHAEKRHNDKLFRVGTSVVDISPDKPMPVGGYGANFVASGVRDPLQVRAFFVGRGEKAVTFVSVDAQGWFAS